MSICHHTAGSRPTRRRAGWLQLVVAIVLLATALSAQAGERLRVVSTFTIIDDWVATIGGEHVDPTSLTPVGAEVHEWELKPNNFVALEEADLVFANGLGLEQWMGQVEATVPAGTPIVALADAAGYPTQPIRIGEFEGEPDPHQWMDPRAAHAQVEVLAEALADADPAHADAYRHNAQRYQVALEALHDELAERFADIPTERRVLISSEAAFPYFADAYDFVHDGVWGSNAEEEGTPRQIARIIDVIEERRPAALFWESTISDRYVRSIADDTDTPIAGPLYVDSLGGADSAAASYIEMMRRNADLLVETLGP